MIIIFNFGIFPSFILSVCFVPVRMCVCLFFRHHRGPHFAVFFLVAHHHCRAAATAASVAAAAAAATAAVTAITNVQQNANEQYGLEEEQRNRLLRTYIRNAFSFHLNEIFSAVRNEYTDWDKPIQHPINIR